jgi:hypothetical protein
MKTYFNRKYFDLAMGLWQINEEWLLDIVESHKMVVFANCTYNRNEV